MVIPPVVVSAVMPVRTPIPAAVLIEMAMRPSRDNGAYPCEILSLRVSRSDDPVKPGLEVFCANWQFGEYRAANPPTRLAVSRSFYP
jgi:hypothetical protein